MNLTAKHFLHGQPRRTDVSISLLLKPFGKCREGCEMKVIRANKQIDLNPKTIDDWAKII